MQMRRFGKSLVLFAMAIGLVLASCNQDDEDEGGSGGGSSSGTTRLVENVWTDGKISKEGQIKKYTVSVTKGTRYFIWLNDSDDGDRTKDADVGLKISHEDGTVICSSYNDANSLYTKPLTFSASSTGTVMITAAAYKSFHGWEQGIGTYAIRYTSRPEYITLSNDNWYEDDIITNGQTNKYYIPVTAGKSYSIYLDDTDAGNGITTKTADVGLKIFYNGGTVICNSYNDANSLYTKPYTFKAPTTGTVTITAAAYKSFSGWEKGTGTYAIKYTIGDSN